MSYSVCGYPLPVPQELLQETPPPVRFLSGTGSPWWVTPRNFVCEGSFGWGVSFGPSSVAVGSSWGP